MTTRWTIRRSALITTALAMMLARATPGAAYDYKYYAWLTETTECPTSSSNLPPMDDMLESWADEMDDEGWNDAGHGVDNFINLDRFCDPDSSISGCNDHTTGIDEGDAVMIGTHGSDSGDHWTGLLRDSGTSAASCRMNSTDDFRAGDYDAEVIHLVSCHSLDDDIIPQAWQLMEDVVDSPSSGLRLRILTGFHGDAAIGTSFTGEYEQVAHDGFRSSVADAWVDNLFDGSVQYVGETGTYDQCPIAVALGATESGCEDRILDTEYDTGSDPSDDDYYCYSYIEDCDPLDEGPFIPPS